MKLKLIITGATGMVGEGVLLTCLEHPDVEKVLMVNRRSFDLRHPKLEELIVPDLSNIETVKERFRGYDGCFFCAGISSIGLKEDEYRRITYDLTLSFAGTLASIAPNMTFIYVSGASTDSTEKGRMMWARVKGKTENDLQKLPFKKVYNFRPGFMKIFPGQRNVNRFYKYVAWLFPIVKSLGPNSVSTMQQVGLAMINCVKVGYPKNTLEIKDINSAAT